MYDILIANGYIFDGAGNPWVTGDIGLKEGRIVAMGALKKGQAAERIDAAGLAVSPGFLFNFWVKLF